MASKEDTQKLIKQHSRRLQIFKERQAKLGSEAPPSILLEIDDIETQIETLQNTLAALTAPDKSASPQAPLIHIHNWTERIDKSAEVVEFLDWHTPGKFENMPDRTRRVPPPALWRKALMPQLYALGDKYKDEPTLRLEGRCALSTGFALGHIFSAKERYQLEIAQYVPQRKQVEYWAGEAQTPSGQTAPEFTATIARSSPPEPAGQPNEAIIVVNALSGKSTAAILEDVGHFWGEPEAFSQLLTGDTEIQAVKGLLVLEAKMVTEHNHPLEGWEAAVLADRSRQVVTDFNRQIKPEKLHLFLAAPLGLALFLGHYWNNIRKPVQCYEAVNTDQIYAPTCEFRLE